MWTKSTADVSVQIANYIVDSSHLTSFFQPFVSVCHKGDLISQV